MIRCYVTLLLLLSAYVGAQNEQPTTFLSVNDINRTVECLRTILQDGIEGYFGSLELIKLPPFEIHPDFIPFNGDYHFSDIEISGLTKFWLKDVTIIVLPPSAKFSLIVPISVKGKYRAANGMVMELAKVWGNGNFKFDTEIELAGRGEINLPLKPLQLKSLEVYPKLKTNIDLTGFFEDEHMSNIVGRQAAIVLDDLVDYIKEDVLAILGPMITDTINIFLRGEIELPPEILIGILDILNNQCDLFPTESPVKQEL